MIGEERQEIDRLGKMARYREIERRQIGRDRGEEGERYRDRE